MTESALDVTMVLHYASDDAVRTIAAHRLQLVGSDGIFGARPHPRLYGTAPRFLGRFSLREGLLPAEEAVARLTARAADRLGLSDRGRIAPGKRADLVLLDPERYVDTATYADPPVAGGRGRRLGGRNRRLAERGADRRPPRRRRPLTWSLGRRAAGEQPPSLFDAALGQRRQGVLRKRRLPTWYRSSPSSSGGYR